MEVLQLDGKKFIKATAVARELGYTSDYVGQLCRSGKVNAHLVGRSWYVDKNSIRDHKSSRYRSSKKKTQEALKTSLAQADAVEPVKVRIASSSPRTEEPSDKAHHFYGRMSVPKVKYAEDGSELIPNLTQKETGPGQKLEVRLADAEQLKIEKTTDSYEMKASELPKIRFEGELPIEEPSESENREETTAQDPDKDTDVKSASQAPVSGTSGPEETNQKEVKKRALLHPTDESPKEMKVAIHRQQVAFADRLAVLESGNLDVRTPRRHPSAQRQFATAEIPQPPSARMTLSYAVGAALLAFCLSIAVLSTEQHYTSNSNSQGSASLSLNPFAALEVYERLK